MAEGKYELIKFNKIFMISFLKSQFLTIFFLIPILVLGENRITSTKQIGSTTIFTPKSGYSMYVKVTDENREGLQIEGDYNMATRSSVKITAKKRGTWQFGVTHGDGTATVYIWTVVDVVNIDIPSNITLKCGETYTYNPVITDEKATTSLSWHSSNPAVASISETGVLATREVGSTIITVTASNGVKATSNVVVTDVKVQDITIDEVPVLKVGDVLQLNYSVFPANATNKKVTFQSTAPSIVDVSPTGELNALSVGSAYIIISSTDNSNVSSSVKVYVEEPTLDKHSVEIRVNGIGFMVFNTIYGNTVDFNYSPYSDLWKVNEIMFNGMPFLPIDEDKRYITPEIIEDSYIDISIEPTIEILDTITDGIEYILDDNIDIRVLEQNLIIKGLKEKDTVDIYIINGLNIYSKAMLTDCELSINLPKNTYVIVINGTSAFKVII